MDSLSLGTVVDGRYRIEARIARGGMATVYRALDTSLDRVVALKMMHPYLAAQPAFTARFRTEARAAARLSNPHVVSVFDQGMWASPDGSAAYLTMEFMAGPDLRSELRRFGSFNLGTVLELLDQVLDALAAAHRAGIVHRDIKPENILLEQPLPPASTLNHAAIQAKVADFGLARAVSTATTSTASYGTVAYLAPELIESSDAATPRSDLYAVGIMAFELLTGTLPFHGETPISVAFQHLNAPMPRVGTQATWLPDAVDSLIGLLTAKDPSRRPIDAAAALTELRRIRAMIPREILIRRIPVIPLATVSRPAHGEPTRVRHAAHTRRVAHAGAAPELTRRAAAVGTGPNHASEVPATRKRSARPKRRRWPWLLVFLLVAAAAGAAWWFLAGPGRRIPVPDVTGQSAATATETLAQAGFTVNQTQDFSDSVTEGLVISTDPAAGASILTTSPVQITVSRGVEMVTVPDVSGMSEQDATATLQGARLTPSTTEAYSETVERGGVVEQSAAPGTSLPHDSTVEITVSKGREPIEVPNVTNTSRADAVARIEQAGLKADATEAFSDTTAAGTVISQDPADGTLFRGDTVHLTISKGPELVEVPDVLNMPFDEAKETLESAGFKVERKDILGGYLGFVRGESPTGKQKPGTTITLSVV
ncbi:Stk1 family PASTA domain-containing Ser/Thr kinase [Neoactinobaculum massilliense]|uniref:Stk1 family PASTA domain-containing Ser/Thr kinase n=1 Tax=Neoactinobaculum massilliense TaxID=2364794 RepID=UPI0013DE7568|nr:Stk1 family PASTA domain-containing Ser/Thr kinase [Neoactinobaculum massilliense]